jgi:hypothetical protein
MGDTVLFGGGGRLGKAKFAGGYRRPHAMFRGGIKKRAGKRGDARAIPFRSGCDQLDEKSGNATVGSYKDRRLNGMSRALRSGAL